MFNKTKYTIIYYNIINKAKCQDRKKKNGIYYEKHHIIPKSLGGNNKKENKILLTAKEHFICHLLLLKMVNDGKHKRKMWYAFHSLSMVNKNHKRNFNSKLFVFYREKHMKCLNGENNPNYGNYWTDEQKEKAAAQKRGKWSGNKNPSCDPAEIKKLRIEQNIGNKNPNFGKSWIKKNDQEKVVYKNELDRWLNEGWVKGRYVSNEIRLKISQGCKGRIPWNKKNTA